MKFITEENKEEKPTFEKVENDQFFVHKGNLYQKVSDDRGNKIANREGYPEALDCISFHWTTEIDKICPKVIKIEFQ